VIILNGIKKLCKGDLHTRDGAVELRESSRTVLLPDIQVPGVPDLENVLAKTAFHKEEAVMNLQSTP
jgi:hypothetical protein